MIYKLLLCKYFCYNRVKPPTEWAPAFVLSRQSHPQRFYRSYPEQSSTFLHCCKVIYFTRINKLGNLSYLCLANLKHLGPDQSKFSLPNFDPYSRSKQRPKTISLQWEVFCLAMSTSSPAFKAEFFGAVFQFHPAFLPLDQSSLPLLIELWILIGTSRLYR